MTQRRQRLGRRGEAVAEDYLRRRGCRILARNYRCPLGELDLVAEEGGAGGEWCGGGGAAQTPPPAPAGPLLPGGARTGGRPLSVRRHQSDGGRGTGAHGGAAERVPGRVEPSGARGRSRQSDRPRRGTPAQLSCAPPGDGRPAHTPRRPGRWRGPASSAPHRLAQGPGLTGHAVPPPRPPAGARHAARPPLVPAPVQAPRTPPVPADLRAAPEAPLGVASSSRRVQWLRRAVPPALDRAAHPSRQTRTPSVRSTGPARRSPAAARPSRRLPPTPQSWAPPAGRCAGRRGRPAPPG